MEQEVNHCIGYFFSSILALSVVNADMVGSRLTPMFIVSSLARRLSSVFSLHRALDKVQAEYALPETARVKLGVKFCPGSPCSWNYTQTIWVKSVETKQPLLPVFTSLFLEFCPVVKCEI